MTQNKFIPLIPVNPDGLDDIAESLLSNSPQQPPQDNGDQTPAKINNREKYIILPARTHGKYSYPTMLISMERTHQDKNWYDTHKALAQEGNSMLTIRQYVDFLSLLKSGNVVDGRAKNLNKKRIEEILDDILTVRDPWRGEWLDADFKVKKDKLYINYGHKVDPKGKIIPKYSEPLLPTLMQNKQIDIADWLAHANSQGLPSENVKDGSMYYYFPMNDDNSVAGFIAGSDWAFLNCYVDPSDSYSALGVRASRAKI